MLAIQRGGCDFLGALLNDRTGCATSRPGIRTSDDARGYIATGPIDSTPASLGLYRELRDDGTPAGIAA